MRTISSLVLVAVIQLAAYTECFKFDQRGHGVPDLVLPPRLLRQKEHYYQPLEAVDEDDSANNHLLYISNNRQRPINGLYQDHLESNTNYRKTLDAIAAEAALAASTSSLDDAIIDEDDLNPDTYSEELHLDDFIPNDDEDEVASQLQEAAEETASHSSLMAGHQYVSGGAGEGKQHLHPDGTVSNKEEIKSDEDLPAYCDPPNPCPLGYLGDDCDARPYHEFSAEYSKAYQEQQNCMCDDDHNDCQKNSKNSKLDNKMNDMMMGNLQQMTHVEKKYSAAVAKKSPRIRRDTADATSNQIKSIRRKYHQGQAIRKHVAKKSAGTS